MKTITDTGHHLIKGERGLECDCGWKPISPVRDNQLAEAIEHHRRVCEELVSQSGWLQRLFSWPLRMMTRRSRG